MNNHAFLRRYLTLTISVASLIACSGDQGASSSSPDLDHQGPTQPSPANQIAVRGQVIDGYLSNALVCIDNNDNFICDAAGEYRTTTTDEGRFELTVPAGQAVDKLMAQIVPGQTVDMDNPEQTLTKQSVLLPINVKSGDNASNLVTPFTTVIGALAKESGETVDVVAAKLAEKWALQDDFYSVDYVAANSSNKDAPVRAAAREIQQKWEEVIAKQASDNAGASWSQILASSTTAFASDDVQQDLDNDVQVVVRPAAAVLTIDDAANTLDWAFVTGFDQSQHYEYSVNNGASFQAVSAKPVALENLAYATGQVQLRVRAGVVNNNPVGVAAKNATALTRIIDDIAAPKNLLVNDTQDTLDWDNVSGYSNLSDYEYRITSGSQQRDWQAVNVKPLVIGDFDVAVNAIEIRVKAVASKNLAGQVASNPQAFKAVVRNIAAPTNLVVDDVANTLNWQFVNGFTSAGDYEYHTGNGQWQTVNAKPLQVGDVAIAAGVLQLRVKATTGQIAGASASNDVAFNIYIRNIPAPISASDDSANTFTWMLVSGFSNISAYEIKIGSADWRVATDSDRSISVGAENRTAGYVQVRVAAVTGINDAGAIVQSPAFTRSDIVTAPTNLLVNDTEDTLDWIVITGFEDAADYQYALVVAGETQAWKNASAKPIQLSDDFVGTVKMRVAGEQNEVAESTAFTKTEFVKLNADGERLLSTATDFVCIKDNKFSGGMYWQKSDGSYSGDIPFRSDNAATKTVESEVARTNAADLCGYSDWQPASIAEMQVLAGYTFHDADYNSTRTHWGNGKFFGYLQDASFYRYWSRDIPLNGDTPDETKRRTAYRSTSSFGTNTSELNYDNYVLLSRAPVVGAAYVAKVAASKSELSSAQATLPGWQTDARNSVTTSQSEFTAAVNSADLIRLKNLLLARVDKANTRQDSVNTLTRGFDAKLAEFKADVTLLNNNPDGQVSDAELQQFNAALAEFETALTAYKTAQNSDLTDAVATLAAMQSKVAGVLDDTATAAQLATDTAAANAQLLAANTQAGEVTAAQQAVTDTPNDAALAETLYLAARTGLSEIYKAQQTLADLQQRRQALVDLIAELTTNAFGSNLIAAYQNQLGVLDQQITNLQNWINTRTPVTDLAVDNAFANGYTVSVASATVVSGGVSFAKLDQQGRYIPADTTYVQGYRCVQDLRAEQDKTSSAAVIWRLLKDGSDDLKNRQDFVAAQALMAEANTNNWCGKTNWSLPTVKQLGSLNTFDDDKGPYYDTTIDPAVFVNYAGSEDKYGSSDAFKRYWQWTSVAGNAGEQFAYAFNTDGYYKAETLSLDAADTLDSGYLVFARLVSFTAPPSKFEMLNVVGEVTTSADEWVCSRHKDNGRIWLRESKMPQAGVARELAEAKAEIEMANVCGSSDWHLPGVAELQALRPVDEHHFATINEETKYMTSATEKDVYDRVMPVVFSFKTGNSETGRNSNDYMGLWVTNATGSAKPRLASGFVGLDKLGKVTVSGVNYCVREESSGNVWTTHLSVSKDASSHSTPSGFTSYCGISGGDWSYPTVEQMKSLYSEPAKTNLHGDRVTGGSYWTSDIKDDPACSGWGCDQIAIVITHEGNEQQLTIERYSSSAPKNHNRYIHKTN